MFKKSLLGVILVSSFFSCSNEEIQEVSKKGTNLKFSLGISEVKTKGIGPGADEEGLSKEVRNNIKSIRLEFKSSSDVVLAYHELNETQLAAIKGNKAVVFEDIHTSTAKVSAYMNTVSDDEVINKLQQNAGYELKNMEYSGTGDVTPSTNTQPDGHILWNATVQVSPTLSRFEVKGESELQLVPTPKDNPDAKREEVGLFFSEEVIKKKEKEARDLYIAEHGEPTEEFTYQYSLVFTPFFEGETFTTKEVYVNNFMNTRTATNLVYHKGDGINDWEDIAKTNYGTNGDYSHMWDEYNLPESTVAGYNLFPQKASMNDLETVRKEMPHIILKLEVNQNGILSTRWLTIRSFFEKNAPQNRVVSFDAGSVYRLNTDAIKLNRYIVSLTVSANGGKPTEPEITNPDPTDPMPEPVQIDLAVGLEIMDWTYVDVTPEL
ncbi:MAG: hypothetical protein ACRCX4_12415 [Bacteroidales bacterium]